MSETQAVLYVLLAAIPFILALIMLGLVWRRFKKERDELKEHNERLKRECRSVALTSMCGSPVDHLRRVCVQNGYGEWRANPSTGEMEFHLIERKGRKRG